MADSCPAKEQGVEVGIKTVAGGQTRFRNQGARSNGTGTWTVLPASFSRFRAGWTGYDAPNTRRGHEEMFNA